MLNEERINYLGLVVHDLSTKVWCVLSEQLPPDIAGEEENFVILGVCSEIAANYYSVVSRQGLVDEQAVLEGKQLLAEMFWHAFKFRLERAKENASNESVSENQSVVDPQANAEDVSGAAGAPSGDDSASVECGPADAGRDPDGSAPSPAS